MRPLKLRTANLELRTQESGRIPTSYKHPSMSLASTIRREVRVATSRRAQPVWFRVLKWAVVVVLVSLYWRSATFWKWMLVAFGVAITLHMVWRWKTKGWTQPWGGWNDVDAGRDADGESNAKSVRLR